MTKILSIDYISIVHLITHYLHAAFIRVTLSDINIFTDMLLAKGGSNIRLFKDETSFYVYIYKSTWSRTNIEVFSDNHNKFYFTDVTDQISISDLEEISIS